MTIKDEVSALIQQLTREALGCDQARNQGGEAPPRNFSPPWKNMLDII